MCEAKRPMEEEAASLLKSDQEHQPQSLHDQPEPTLLTPFIDAKPHEFAAKKDPLSHLEEGGDAAEFRRPEDSVASGYVRELYDLGRIALPMVLNGLFLYSRTWVSMVFLGRLGGLPLAGGSLAIGFANITGYSIISGLAMGMEPICGQAFGAKKHYLLGITFHRAILMLLCACIPISLLWLNMHRILIFLGQQPDIVELAHYYIVYSLPDLFAQALLHPLRVYLRTQTLTMPITYCALAAIALHFPVNYLLVTVFDMGIRGVALSAAWTNVNIVLCLLCYVCFSKACKSSRVRISTECLRDWYSLVSLAIPSCVSVCLEWWWYEIMILLCGLLLNPKATVASMGILIQTTSLIYIFPSSLSFGVSTRVGNELGANRPDRAKKSMVVGLSCSFVLGFVALCFTTTVRKSWATMYTTDPEILRITAMVLPIIGLCELGNCPQTTGCGVLRGTARPRTGANINLGCFYLVGMPVAVLLAFVMGFDFKGLWLGLMAAQMSCVVTMMSVICRTDWKIQAERAKVLTGGDDESSSTNGASVPSGDQQPSDKLVNIKIDQQR
ncbi:protein DETOXIFICATION 49-like [Nymphaea colorata]|uniref:Protein DETOXIFICATION n=1 Tax=Nymphaea colorata TaxID=210225 RepID=A0A5K1AXI6_9MAGN|nr:protein DETOXIFICATION 49-like [Nymphaea colorata]